MQPDRTPSAASIYPYTVRWADDPERTRVVTAKCKRCIAYAGDWTYQGVISPSGIEHSTVDDATDCGVNATGDEWWWQV